MDQEKKIRFSADSKDLENAFERIKASSKTMSEEILQDAAKRQGTAKQMISFIEEEIKAVEKLNQAEFKQRQQQLEASINQKKQQIKDLGKDVTGKDWFNRENLRNEVSGLEKQSAESKIQYQQESLQTELLRELIDTIIQTSKDEITKDEQRVRDDISKTPHEERTFKQRYQAGLLGIGNEPKEDKDSLSTASLAGGIRGASRGIISAKSPAEAGFNLAQQGAGSMMASGSGALVAGGLIASIIALIGAQMYTSWQDYQRATKPGEAIMGRDVSDMGLDMYKYGYSPGDFTSTVGQIARTRRHSGGAEAAARNQLLLSRGAGIDGGMFGSMEQLAYAGGGTGIGMIQSGVASMRASGITRGGDMSAVPDFLQIMIGLGKEQLSQLGKIDMGVNMKMVSALADMDETLRKSPEALSTMVNAIRGGLTGSTSKQSQALQYAVLSQMSGGADMWELMKMKEDPFSKENQEYLPKFLDMLHKVSGGNKSRFFMNIQSQFGLKANMAEKLGEGHLSGDLSEFIDKDFEGAQGIEDLEGRASGATVWEDLQIAKKNSRLVRAGDRAVNPHEQTPEEKERFQQLLTELSKSSTTLEKISIFLIRMKSLNLPFP